MLRLPVKIGGEETGEGEAIFRIMVETWRARWKSRNTSLFYSTGFIRDGIWNGRELNNRNDFSGKKKKKEENQHRLFILFLVRKVVKNGSINSKDDLTRRQQLSTTILLPLAQLLLRFSILVR